MSEIIVIGTYDFDPGRRDGWLDYFADVATSIRAEPGCLELFVSADPESDDRVNMVQRYRDAQAWDDHLKNPSLAKYRDDTKASGLWPKEHTVRMYEAVERS